VLEAQILVDQIRVMAQPFLEEAGGFDNIHIAKDSGEGGTKSTGGRSAEASAVIDNHRALEGWFTTFPTPDNWGAEQAVLLTDQCL
jgi:hypothetical protein